MEHKISQELERVGCPCALRNEILWCVIERESNFSRTGIDKKLASAVDTWMKSVTIDATVADHIVYCINGWSGDVDDRRQWLGATAMYTQ
jgi:hypothetical protein